MSKALVTFLLALAAIFGPRSTYPEASARAAKIGIINIQDAIFATNEGKKEFDALKTKFLPKQTELESQNAEVKKLKADLRATGNQLSEEQRASQLKTLDTKQKQLQRSYEDVQTEYQKAEQEVVNRIGSKMLTVLEKYATANRYAIVLDISNSQTPVLWADQGANITKDLVDIYDGRTVAQGPLSMPVGPTKIGIVRIQDAIANNIEAKKEFDEGKELTLLEKYTKTNGYVMVLDVSNLQTPALWAAQETDITKELWPIHPKRGSLLDFTINQPDFSQG
jgi:Skp family chaperone for outer membrane proteins